MFIFESFDTNFAPPTNAECKRPCHRIKDYYSSSILGGALQLYRVVRNKKSWLAERLLHTWVNLPRGQAWEKTTLLGHDRTRGILGAYVDG